MNRRPAHVLVAIALSLALSACGNKGPLVLPDKPDTSQPTTQPAPPTPPTGTPAGTPAAQAQGGDAAR